MARHRIFVDGKPTRYFWSDRHGDDASGRTVFKRAGDRVIRMKGVVFDVARKRLRRA